MSTAPGYPRWQTAPPRLPHVEAQKARRDAVAPRDPLAADPAGRRVYRLRPPEGRREGVSERLRAMLDDEQLAAVEGARGRSLVLAAAGSGKTRTIVATVAHLVETGTPPEAIMLVTFTRRAAREMTDRAERLVGVDLSGMTAGTFHSVCRRILHRYGPVIGVPSTFTVLDAEDQAEVAALARDAVLEGRERRPALPKPAAIVGWAALAAEGGRELEEVVLAANPRLADRLEDLRAIADGYAERKRAMAALDYADLLVHTARLLHEHPRVRRRLAQAHRWVLVDELHDVNPVQAAIVEALAGEGSTLVAVADPDQSIYSWRGADPRVVERFAAAPGTRVFPLGTNYRSTPEVVALAQETLPAGNPFGKRMRAHRPGAGARPVVAHLTSVQDEARFVVQRIADLITEGREPGDIAVLYRAHHHSVDLQLALAEAGVEFELFSGARFVESAHVKDALAFCRMRHNPRDELAWRRALRLFERVGAATAARVWAHASVQPDPLAAAAALADDGAAPAGLRRFGATAAALRATDRPEEIVLLVARADWYRDHLQRRYANWRDREGDLARLAELATRSAGLDAFLGELQLAERVEADEDVSGPARRVALSSVHQAKGLEWPVVFVLQVEPGSFPSGWAVSEGNLDEEERLFHVAVTRAADELYLCRPIAARRPWDTGADAVVLNSGQGFLDRDLGDLVEEWSVR
ncbi:ATP-dependent helicase [Miltoncostaea marina]|uniref:ATP-dependent helicase n=1 Tax=Miltoncostaea marina TaxID=2843215 RepID=UPI001C3C7E10|nr:ATP-dependent helicase [Miltoncostaea marina]